MRRHDVTTLRAIARLKQDNGARPTRASEQALMSAPERDKRKDKFTILSDSSKNITCLDIHRNARLKHSNSSTVQNTLSPTAAHMEHHGNSKETGIQTIQIPTRSALPTFRLSSHRSCSHCAFPHPRTRPRGDRVLENR